MPTLPRSPTPFVGRVDELTEIAHLMADPACRLLTLVGPGGIGKTRLALQLAEQFAPLFDDGVCFVPLAPLTNPQLVVSALANALGIASLAGEDVSLQIVYRLEQKRLLLIMDNFEHLLDATGLLTQILDAAPGVQILATSRERLNLQEEWVFTLAGLSFPEDQAGGSFDDYSAVQLFVQRAGQVQSSFSLTENADAVVALCRRVEGMPLALELAATWLRVMSCRQIVAQIEHSLDFLTTPLRNVPERHRSLRAVFEHSWSLLSAVEQSVMAALTIFRGGFDFAAAHEVAGASLPILAALVDKSLIRLNPADRYDMHELLHQFGHDRLIEAGDTTTVARLHLAYFLNLGLQVEANAFGSQESALNDRAAADLDNIRAAMSWSIADGDPESGLRLAVALEWFWENRGYQSEADDWLRRLLTLATKASPSVRAKALHRIGEIAGFLGDPQARASLTDALALAREANDRRMIAWSLTGLAVYTEIARSLPESAALLEESLSLFRAINDPLGISHVLRRRAMIAINERNYPYVRLLVEEGLAQARVLDDRSAKAWTLSLLGNVIWLQNGDFHEAEALHREGLALFHEIHDDSGASWPLIHLAAMEQFIGNDNKSWQLYREALHRLREAGVYRGVFVTTTLVGLGGLEAAKTPERSARLLAASDQGVSEMNLHDAAGQTPMFPAIDQFSSAVALARTALGDAAFADAWAAGKAMTAEQAIAYALTPEFRFEDVVAERLHEPAKGLSAEATGQTLSEPLSEREQEILRLVAAGYSNGQIGAELFLAVGTVKWYLHSINSKLGVTSRTQAVARARDLGLFS